ncbi:hypothetical protein [Pedomonas mirosovicensis]|uniref:hypothetical protein n=1 Tax=Pedomonas mirosovicensis TaxID=2908641 RepID=UPI002167FFA8|nr:hypothetical protein [Pedomonas mirosovicensis]MCH8685673.1 hypothetical protein [Pedomonas mirosovicensis]
MIGLPFFEAISSAVVAIEFTVLFTLVTMIVAFPITLICGYALSIAELRLGTLNSVAYGCTGLGVGWLLATLMTGAHSPDYLLKGYIKGSSGPDAFRDYFSWHIFVLCIFNGVAVAVFFHRFQTARKAKAETEEG